METDEPYSPFYVINKLPLKALTYFPVPKEQGKTVLFLYSYQHRKKSDERPQPRSSGQDFCPTAYDKLTV